MGHLVGEDLEDAPGAGADVEQRGHLLLGDERGELALHLVVMDVERAQLVPAAGDLAEVVFGAPRALAHQLVEPAQVAQHRRVRSEENTSELKSLMRTSYAVFGLTKKN